MKAIEATVGARVQFTLEGDFRDGDYQTTMLIVKGTILSIGRIYATVLTDGGIKKRVRLSLLHFANNKEGRYETKETD